MSWDHTATITSSETWPFPSPPPRDYLVHVEGVGGGGGGGNGSVGSYWVQEVGQYEPYWEYDPQLGFDVLKYRYVVLVPAHYEYYNTSGGGGEAGAPGSADITLPNQSDIPVTIGSGGTSNTAGGATSFGTLFSLVGGNQGGAASGNSNGSGGSGGPGNDGSAGNNSSPGIGGAGTNGYGAGANGGTGNNAGNTGQSGYLTISWNDAGYAYVMEGE